MVNKPVVLASISTGRSRQGSIDRVRALKHRSELLRCLRQVVAVPYISCQNAVSIVRTRCPTCLCTNSSCSSVALPATNTTAISRYLINVHVVLTLPQELNESLNDTLFISINLAYPLYISLESLIREQLVG